MPVERRKNQKLMGLQDAVMLWADSPARPLHVGGYFICRPPPNARQDFVHRLVTRLRQHRVDAAPWNYRIARGCKHEHTLLPSWEIVRRTDMRYHVVHHVLHQPADQAALDALLSRLHSERLDMSRPLWQYHIIEGLHEHRFAIYHKVHHALVDGFLGMQAFVGGTTDDATASVQPVWSSRRKRAPGKSMRTDAVRSRSAAGTLPAITHLFADLKAAIPHAIDAFTRVLDAARQESPALITPCAAPNSVFNTPITAGRCVATASLDLAVVKAIARQHSATVNDVLLAICGSALRRYLNEHRALPAAPLVALVPVALNRSTSEDSGNSLGLVYASLGSHQTRTAPRIKAVSRTMLAGKAHLQAMPENVRGAYCLISLLPTVLHLWSPALVPPSANVVVSNMRGPERQRYLNRAVIERVYPLSTIVSGMALNITCVSYGDRLFLGLVGCPDVTPDLPRLAALLSEAADDLHAPRRARAQPRSRR